jgi:hypothetical protein
MTASVAIRAQLFETLRRDLIGPDPEPKDDDMIVVE